MASVKITVPSLLQGMSQQAVRLRRNTEAELQVNAVSDTTYGLGTRPGTQHVSPLSGVNSTPKLWDHWIDRDDSEQYVVTFDGNSLRVSGLDGQEYSVTIDGAALNYLSTSDPLSALYGLTVQDTTFVVNRTITTKLSTEVTDTPTPQALVWVRAGNYKTKYTITVDGTTTTYETLGSGAGGAAETIQTTTIAEELSTALATDLGAGYTVTYPADTSVILIEKDDGSEFEATVADSVGDSQIELALNRVNSFADLPPKAPDGYIAQVIGLDEASEDDYWVRFTADDPSATVSDGRWEETVAPGVRSKYDASSMPHQLRRLQDDGAGTVTGEPYKVYFDFSQVTWADSPAGDDESNPAPSFIGQELDSLFVLDDRLGFLSGGQVVLSSKGDFFQLRRTTMLTLNPDDRIDATAGDGRVVNLRYAVSLSEQLLLSGDDALMAVPTDVPIEPASFRFTTATQLRVDTGVAPLVVGRSLFLPVRNGDFSDVRESSANGAERVKDSSLITSGVPELLLGSVTKWSADDTSSSLYIKTSAASRRLYVYKWLDSSSSRVQSSWGFWKFSNPILGFKIFDKKLWLIMDRNGTPTLEYIDLDPGLAQTGQPLPFRLDRYAVLTTPAIPSNPDAEPDDPDDPDDDPDDPTDPPDGMFGSGTDFSGPGIGDADQLGNPESPSGSSSGSGVADPSVSAVPFGGGNSGQGIASVSDPTGPTTPVTELELPYPPNADLVILRADTGEFLRWDYSDSGPNTIELEGDVASVPLVAGELYDMLYRFSEAMLRRPTASGGITADTSGRLQLLRLRVNYDNSGAFHVDLYDDSTYVNRSSFVPHDAGDFLQPFRTETGTMSIPIRMKSTRASARIRVRNVIPCWFVSAEWEADFSSYGSVLS